MGTRGRNIIRPTLKYLGDRYDTIGAEQILLGTAIQESGGFQWRRQREYINSKSTKGGFGYYQVEEATLNSLYNYGYRRNFVRTTVDKLRGGMPKLKALQYNDEYVTAIARMKYFSRAGTIPDYDIVGQAIYWKTQYNTAGGAGTVEQYLDRWKRYVNDDLYGIWAY